MSTERMSLAGSVRVLRARPTARLRLEESGAHVERRRAGRLVVDPPRVDRVRESRGRGARSAFEVARGAGIATGNSRVTPPWLADVRGSPSWMPPVERRRGWGKVLDPARPRPVLLGGRM